MVICLKNVFSELQMDDKIRRLFEDTQITKVSTNSSRDFLRVYLTSDHLIAKDQIRRLEQKMAEVLSTAGIDENRILAEAAIFADHIAVDEETVRLRSHMSQLTGMINGNSPTGRKIDFLIQEFNREANTIGSKCQNSEIAHVVVDLKSEIEKIREQIQNIE